MRRRQPDRTSSEPQSRQLRAARHAGAAAKATLPLPGHLAVLAFDGYVLELKEPPYAGSNRSLIGVRRNPVGSLQRGR